MTKEYEGPATGVKQYLNQNNENPKLIRQTNKIPSLLVLDLKIVESHFLPLIDVQCLVGTKSVTKKCKYLKRVAH